MPTEPDPGEQDVAEQIDEEAIDPLDFPPERPLGVEEFGITAAEEEGGESVADRYAREDHRLFLREEQPPTAGLIDPDDDREDDVTPELVAERADEPDALSAEEAAVHLTDEA